jgi:hypothetical protein
MSLKHCDLLALSVNAIVGQIENSEAEEMGKGAGNTINTGRER